MTFATAIGGMRHLNQWFLWCLEWDAEKNKYKKYPCPTTGYQINQATGEPYRINGGDPANWMTFDAACQAHALLPKSQHRTYALGFWLTVECGYWFLDIDMMKCDLPERTATPFAMQMLDSFPGAFGEWSSSLRGLHIIGRGQIPEHRNKPPKDISALLKPLDLEFYTCGRGIAFGLDGVAQGNADTQCNVFPLCATYFPPRVAGEPGEGPRAEWRGPADDDVLIERMLGARSSAAVVFGNKLSVAQLWRGECEHNSDSDASLIAHLAFWTGCDEERIYRLMLRSGLKRDKWFERRPNGNFLQYSISRIVADCDKVYQEPVKETARVDQIMYGSVGPVLQVEGSDADDSSNLITVQRADGDGLTRETYDRVDALLAEVDCCESEFDLLKTVIPRLRDAGIPVAFQEKVIQALRTRLRLWNNTMPVAKLRLLVFPPSARALNAGQLPDWAKDYCFVLTGDYFFNTRNGAELSMVGFQAKFGKLMPLSDAGRRESAAEKCLHFWNMPVVERIGYRPDQPGVYEWDGVEYANRYSPASVPVPAASYTQIGLDGINAFQAHLYDMCGRRLDVFNALLYWMAHNVQHPGKKIRWSPIIKGIHGDGKTLIVTVLRAAMGFRNVSTTGSATLTASGGFNDWALGGAVNVIEEIMLTGKQRHQLYNAMKEFISNDVVNVNAKGAKTYSAWNCTNHWANTNHNDAIPMENGDRRWFVVFTPWEDKAAMYRYCGFASAEAWAAARTVPMDRAWRYAADELRAWFLSLQIPADFDINGEAPWTPEKMRMMASSKDDAESIAEQLLEDGAVGVSKNVVSSAALGTALGFKASGGEFEVPKGWAMNHMLTRLGYAKFPKIVKWNGRTHTLWLRNGFTADVEGLRSELDRTLNPNLNLPN